MMDELYDEVSSGREIERVLAAAARNQKMGGIDKAPMWADVGVRVRATREPDDEEPLNPFTAAVFVAGMMAQVDTLRTHGHSWTEVCNESIIEAIDSLLPYMHARGIAYMVDNCSDTARRGTRMWGPRFMQMLRDEVFVSSSTDSVADSFANFIGHEVHSALAACMRLRPPIDIAVPA
jgi:ketol-acid reductoisomerase